MERKAGHQLLVRNLIATFPGLPAPVLDIPCLEINSGERVALMGPSGSGKTTLINILTGMALPTNGEVFWGGRKEISSSFRRREGTAGAPAMWG